MKRWMALADRADLATRLLLAIATAFNVGDSRAYRMVEGHMVQVSVDDRPTDPTGVNKGIVTQVLRR